MGGSAYSKDSDSLRKSSAKLKDARDHIVFGVFKKNGTFVCDPSLEEYMKDMMRAVRVRRYLDPMKAKGYGFGHEFLVVYLLTPESCQLLIKAEKVFVNTGDKEHPPGGLVKVTRIYDAPKFVKEHKDRVKYDVNLQGSVKILMKDLFDILVPCDPRYSLWKYNCWKYVYDTLKKLLEKFAGLADTSDDCKKNIREALENVPCPSLPAEILVEAGSVLLGFSFLGGLLYGGAVGTIGAYKFLRGFKMATASGATVKGLAGSSLFKSSMASGIKSLAKRSWVGPGFITYAALGTVFCLVERCASMRDKHCCSATA